MEIIKINQGGAMTEVMEKVLSSKSAREKDAAIEIAVNYADESFIYWSN